MHTINLYVSQGLFWEGIINRYKESVFHQLITYLSDRYFSVSFHRYEHIPLGPSANGSAQMIILAAVIALILASVIITITRSREGRLVRKLLRDGCFSPDTAKTLTQLGEFRSTFIRRALARGGNLTKCVYCAFETIGEDADEDEGEGSSDAETEESSASDTDEATSNGEEKPVGTDENGGAEEEKELRRHEINKLNGEKKIDFTTARFYVPEVLKYRAEVRYEKKGLGWLAVVLTVVISLIGAALVCRFLPDFIQLLDNLLTLSAPQ